jgi:AraC-like DNA-binding protein
MITRLAAPGPPLSDFIECLWLYEGYAPPHALERVLPTGTVELVINLREDEIRVFERQGEGPVKRCRGAVLCGPYSEHFVIDTAQQASVIGVHFKPGGAFPFFRPPVGELAEAHIPLDEIWGAAAPRLRERLLEAATPAERLRVLELSLLAQLVRPPAQHPAVALALRAFSRAPGEQAIAAVASQTGLCPRRFIQLFRDEVGLTPKRFCRVLRFQGVIARVERQRRVDWAGLALAAGYFDQAHFIRDFKAFSGLSPTAYLAQKTEHRNHVPLGG